MYETHFGWVGRPFPSVIQLENYFPAVAIDAARQVLVRCIHRAEGVGMVVGPSGTGKSLLCQMLAAHFADTFQTVLLSTGQLGSRRAVLQAILHGLRQPHRGMDAAELRLALADYLTASPKCPTGMLLLIDEAHLLSTRLLDELRLVTNLVVRGQPRARLVLAGDAPLEERLADPTLTSFSQRIVARCYLEPFNRGETEAYITRQIERVGGQGNVVFRPEAAAAVYQASDGIARLVNQTRDHALVLAYSRGLREVDATLVQEAWSELQQLPSPWALRPKAAAPADATIEFGGLDDDADDADQPAAAMQHAAACQWPSTPGPKLALADTAADDLTDELADDLGDDRADDLAGELSNDRANEPADDFAAASVAADIEPAMSDEPLEDGSLLDDGRAVSQWSEEPVADDPSGATSLAEDAVQREPITAADESLAEQPQEVPAQAQAWPVEAADGTSCSTVFCDAFELFGVYQQEEVVCGSGTPGIAIRNVAVEPTPPRRKPAAAAATQSPPLDEPMPLVDASPTRPGRPSEPTPVLPMRPHCAVKDFAADTEFRVIDGEGPGVSGLAETGVAARPAARVAARVAARAAGRAEKSGDQRPRVLPVRSQQYSQLFSRLRRSVYGT